MNQASQIIDDKASPTQPVKVLVVEDDVALAQLTADYLVTRNMAVFIEHDGAFAIARITAEKPDVVVLDVLLPGMDGFEICRELRLAGNLTPIVMLTARDEEIDQVLGLELGADDYLVKPVQPRVLIAHLKAVLRRAQLPEKNSSPKNNKILTFGNLEIAYLARETRLGNSRIDLTTAEFDLLWLLASNAGRVLTRNVILKSLRSLEYDGLDRSIDSRVSRLRRKLSDDQHSAHIKTVRPHGYLFSPIAW